MKKIIYNKKLHKFFTLAIDNDKVTLSVTLFEEEEVIGYIHIDYAGKRSDIQRFYILKDEYMNKGLGRRMVAESIRWLKKRGIMEMYVTPSPVTEENLAAYRSYGFKKVKPDGDELYLSF